MSFAHFGLSEEIVQGVYASGFCTPTDIQSMAIPYLLMGRDFLGCAPTGTGKTAAFVLPILHHLTIAKRANYPRALVLSPTRELAQQIDQAFGTYGVYTDIRSFAIYGGVSVSNQVRDLKAGADVIVATPGRLLDLMQRRCITLSRIEYLVIDEADRMYDMGFVKDVRTIIGQVPRSRQTLLFSATMSPQIRSLVKGILKNPVEAEVGSDKKPVETVEQRFLDVEPQEKAELLLNILRTENVESMLVFSRTRNGADRIKKKLDRAGISSSVLHAERTQSQRNRAMEGFRRREFKVLVATDLAARGIDVTGISHVVNFDTPVCPEDYIHRIGRTGRAALTGIAFTFVSEDEQNCIRKLEAHTGMSFSIERYPGFISSRPGQKR